MKHFFSYLVFAFLVILSSCSNNHKTTVTKKPELDTFTKNLQKAGSIMEAASNPVIKENNLIFGIKFGMSKRDVKKKLAVFKQKGGQLDTYFSHDLNGSKYWFSVDQKYKYEQLYSIEIGYLSKGENEELTTTDTESIIQYYSSSFTKRGFKQFQYEDIGSECIHLFYKDNMSIKMSRNGIGSVYIKFVNEPVEKNKTTAKSASKEVVLFAGTYQCHRTGDKYIFNSDGTGRFCIQSKTTSYSYFKWKKNGNKIIITYTDDAAVFGKKSLTYDNEDKTLTERSKLFGVLTFWKK